MDGKARKLKGKERTESIYHDAGAILKQLEEQKGSIKSIVFSLPYSLSRKKALYALTTKTLQYKNTIQSVIEQCRLLEKEPKLTHHVALVLVYDLLYTQHVICKGPLTRMILRHKKVLKRKLKRLTDESKAVAPSVITGEILRYVRINTLKVKLEDALDELRVMGFKLVTDLKDSKEWIFSKDDIVPNLLAFPSSYSFVTSSSILTSSNLYTSHKIILQDKSSCLPAFLLNPAPGSCVIDACAAPGNKTSHLAAIMKNKGIIHAFDRDKSRYRTMEKILKEAGVTCVQTYNEDFLKVSPEQFSDVHYILVDPSCSGSGMVGRLELHDELSEKRLRSLSCFQTMILKHALSFPSVKKVVYSTCSVHKEENEDVVSEALEQFKDHFKLTHLLPQWQTRGLADSSTGPFCIRVIPSVNKAQGFFVAMFEKIGTDHL